MSLKHSPEGNSHIHTVAAILRKALYCIYLPLKCKCHLFFLETCTSGSEVPISPHVLRYNKKDPRHTKPHICFYFPIKCFRARQEFHVSCREMKINSKLKFIFCFAVISAPVLSSPVVFFNLALEDLRLLAAEKSFREKKSSVWNTVKHY